MNVKVLAIRDSMAHYNSNFNTIETIQGEHCGKIFLIAERIVFFAINSVKFYELCVSIPKSSSPQIDRVLHDCYSAGVVLDSMSLASHEGMIVS
jgi:hypothetical protein